MLHDSPLRTRTLPGAASGLAVTQISAEPTRWAHMASEGSVAQAVPCPLRVELRCSRGKAGVHYRDESDPAAPCLRFETWNRDEKVCPLGRLLGPLRGSAVAPGTHSIDVVTGFNFGSLRIETDLSSRLSQTWWLGLFPGFGVSLR
jgi:hypothetical protein